MATKAKITAPAVSNVARIEDGHSARRRDRAPRVSTALTGPVRTLRLTEAGIAERFADAHGDDIRRDHRRRRWLFWSGARWMPDRDGEIDRRGLAFTRAWQRETIEHVEDLDRRAQILDVALKLERKDALRSMLGFAASLPPIADAGDQWDRDPWLMGVANGVVDLRTGVLRPGRRDDRVTMTSPVPYRPEAACGRWERFVSEVFGGDVELAAFIQRAVGYSITGDTTEQCLFLLHGSGANGKSTFLSTLHQVLGDYSAVTPFSTFELKGRASIPNDVAQLVGRRFVMASEVQPGAQLNEARVKALTGGDPMTARFLHGEFFTFEPVAKFWLGLNHVPNVSDESFGFWRRVRLVPFLQRFEIDKQLASELRSEASGILHWAVTGCLAWQQRGLSAPAAIADATRELRSEMDDLAEFFEDATEVVGAAQVAARSLFVHYEQWTKAHGVEAMTETMFGRRCSQRFSKRKVGAHTMYQGLRLRGAES
jgi:putative DNA primase/helicase